MTAQLEAPEIGEIRLLPLDSLQADPDWERTTEGSLDQVSLEELAASIKERGVLEPLRVYELGNGQYLINSGHRRAIASKRAGLQQVPAHVLPRNQERVDEHIDRLVVNIQRKDVSLIEKAKSLQAIQDEAQIGIDELGRLVGLSPGNIGNYVRLLRLPPEIQAFLDQGSLSLNHAYALHGITLPEYDASGPTGHSAREVQVRFATEAVQTQMHVLRFREKLTEYVTRQAEYIAAENRRRNSNLRIVSERPAGTGHNRLEEYLRAEGVQVVRPSSPPSVIQGREEHEKNAPAVLAARASIVSAVLDELFSFDEDGTGVINTLRAIGLLALGNRQYVADRPALRQRLLDAPDLDTVYVVLREIVRESISMAGQNRQITAPLELETWLVEDMAVNAEITSQMYPHGPQRTNIGKRLTWREGHYRFLSPDGEVVEFDGLGRFCREHHISQSRMSKLARGVVSECAGWRLAPDQPEDSATS